MTLSSAGDTIFALSSGAPPAAIAIVRVSGPGAGPALAAIAGSVPEPRRARHAALRDDDGALIDRALLLWMPGPNSATGEDLAEFHLHGGRAVVAALFDRLAGLPGLRSALPGEFTRRAFLHGRIDLTEAEGLADLLSAETAGQHRRALRMAEGGLGRIIERWRSVLLGLSAQIEAAIEFGESDEEVGTAIRIDGALAELAGEAKALLAAPPAERLRDGLRIVAAGPPNSGKSTLINALAGREVALATPIAGTTRDIIEAPVRLDGHAILLTDTAGLRDGAEEVERLGIARARNAIDGADLILWCGAPEDCPAPDRSLLLHTRADERSDVAPVGSLGVSIHDPNSLIALRRSIDAKAHLLAGPDDALSLNARQRALVGTIAEELAVASSMLDPILQAEHLRICRDALDRLVGRSGVEDMLDSLFGRFCLGK
ncbi:tRNA uridine-5-carboxymethylaminomethyl(34) synthesis GTPase MnmE [Sphingomonas sp. AP4-R1]|uniref:tRNA uridine-5-carboxymethylaminomethyl(34) synthesis GTPase MnmE n=1 Tax=Sphingomonas sp. AP4-R1 TaxID=2735134 RepID=UPI0014938D58|nr:tRNA uridine-5-carboxymethylaminomethyl(34) synthesis GTPase MnmE [Sphingomonas sp. AP4-R1]QJU57233.1 tRNA uridine-5-carboxymethylaminomethyl(34) synthesis GTPase MnmE [Sphingomonas sp. AP4-R1]